jgi:arabinogalactan endo-1,4-beta-galactosidase
MSGVSMIRLLLCAMLLPVSLVRAESFAKGADVSWLPQMEESGFTFMNEQGRREDCLKILKDHGCNTIRLRVWVNPSNDPKSGHCSLRETVQMAARASKMGYRIMIDFHYSDSWADPKQQAKPKAWRDHDFKTLKQDVYAHTREVLEALKRKNITPEWVQIGNEIRDGMLWPDGRATTNPENLAELINAGYKATKEIDTKIKVIVHIDRGNDGKTSRWFYDLLEKNRARYDVIGLSYYPYWLGDQKDYRQTIEALGQNLTDLAKTYRKEVMIVEVGGEDSQAEETRAMLSAVIEKVKAVPGNKGLGVIYWEPQGARSWSGYKLSCWGDDGKPTAPLEAFMDSSIGARK